MKVTQMIFTVILESHLIAVSRSMKRFLINSPLCHTKVNLEFSFILWEMYYTRRRHRRCIKNSILFHRSRKRFLQLCSLYIVQTVATYKNDRNNSKIIIV